MSPDEITLREYMERMMLELEKRIEATDRSMDDRLRAIYEKLAGMNELRQVIHEQARTFATRETVEEIRNRLEKCASDELVYELRERITKLATQEALEQTLKTRETRFTAGEMRLKELEDWKNNLEGRQAVRIYLWPILVGLIVFILTQIARIVFPVLPR